MAWMTGWSYRRPLYANTTSIAATSANIPLPVKLSGLVDLTGKVQADFDDAVFASAADGTTVLDYYWEVKSATAAVGHIEVPSLTHGQASLLVGYLYYGKADATDQSDEAGTFSSLIARYALAEATDAQVLDSTANNHDSTANTAASGTGQIGKCLDYELDSADYTSLPASNVLLPDKTSVYASAWVNSETFVNTTYQTIIYVARSASAGYYLMRLKGTASGGIPSYTYPSGTTVATVDGTTALSAGQWYHIAVGKVGNDNWLWVNGVQELTHNAAYSSAPSTDKVTVGASVANAVNFDGLIDEVRISGAQSVSWALAEYMAGAGTLWTWGNEEAAAGTGRALFLNSNIWTGGQALIRGPNL